MTDPKRGDHEDISPELWYRTFTRGIQPEAKGPDPDKDTLATTEQLDDDFVDYWGKRLRTDKAFRKHNTYDELMTQFWGKAYLGPLNGHVNGGIVMKEIHKPWMHWLVGGRGVTDLLDAELIPQLTNARWLTYPGFPPLYGASVQSGETFERIVLDSLRVWFTSRRNKDFFTKKGETKRFPDNIQRWAAHFFLTTNINIAATSNNANIVPSDHFFSYEMLRGYSDLLPNRNLADDQWLAAHILKETPAALTVWNEKQFRENGDDPLSQEEWFRRYSIPSFKYDGPSYLWASRELKLCTLQEVANEKDAQLVVPAKMLAGGVDMGTLRDGRVHINGAAQVNFAVQQWGEGDNPWVILQSSVDDAHGVWTAQKMFLGDDKKSARCQLFSEKTFNALQMVDFWNPVYSWRRLKLMQYIPVKAELLDTPVTDPTTGDDVYSYDLEKSFIEAIKKRMDGKGDLEKLQDEWPEAEFLCNLDKPLIEHQIRIFDYTTQVKNNLKVATCIQEYLKLAESRRRMFRPMPMNFFGSNIPYCLAMPINNPWLEMTEQASIRQIPQQGVRVLEGWLGSLAGSDPNVIPDLSLGNINKLIRKNVKNDTVGLPVTLLPKPSTMRMACQRFIAVTNPETSERPGSCPLVAGAPLASVPTSV
ncbi:hypothetical protein K4K61_012572 [Colletotrichum sp. SAR11_59]|nr:hypothetical protein K4K61_012572 [Colletotrichum sp. SAR11_59]